MILTLSTLAALLELLSHPDARKWAWIAAATAYGSMHALGLGFATWLATAVVLSILLLSTSRGKLTTFRPIRKTLLAALVTLVVLGMVHAVCMYLLVGAPRIPLGPTDPFRFAHVLGLIAIYPMAVAINVFGLLPSSFYAIGHVAGSAAPYGILVVLVAGLGLWTLGRSALGEGDVSALSRLTVHAFSIVAWFAFIGLFAMREIYEIGALDHDLYTFVVDARYVIPFGVTLVGSALLLLASLAYRRHNYVAVCAVALGLTAFCAHVYYDRAVRPGVLANNSISHAKVWETMVAMSRECRAAGLPIPDVPTEALITFSPETRLSYFEGILHDSLQLPRDERCHFIDWKQSRGAERAKFDNTAPSLRRIIKLLRIEDPAP
jgi:hypothetical protein